MNKRQAIKEVRECANAVIDQLERIAKGWDKGSHRDDMPEANRNASNTIRRQVRGHVDHAFELAQAYGRAQ